MCAYFVRVDVQEQTSNNRTLLRKSSKNKSVLFYKAGNCNNCKNKTTHEFHSKINLYCNLLETQINGDYIFHIL